jgi:hypothetical protein
MSSAESDRRDRAFREKAADRNLAEARAGRSRLRDVADQEAPEPEHIGTPNVRAEARP